MDTTDLMDRLTILERAQLLHDATLRRHGEMLDRHDLQLAQQAEGITLLRGLTEQQTRLQAELQALTQRVVERQEQHEDTMRHLAQLFQAIKDLLGRRNGP